MLSTQCCLVPPLIWKLLLFVCKAVTDPEGVPSNPSFEGLLSKILSANVLCILYVQTGAAHLSFTVAITHVYQEFDACEAYVHIYIETISEANERMKAKVLFMHCSLCSYRDGDMLSV